MSNSLNNQELNSSNLEDVILWSLKNKPDNILRNLPASFFKVVPTISYMTRVNSPNTNRSSTRRVSRSQNNSETRSLSQNTFSYPQNNSEQKQNIANSERKLNLPVATEDIQGVCSICRETYKNEEKFVINRCGHKFHFNCLNEWVKQSSVSPKCPLCRKQIPVS